MLAQTGYAQYQANQVKTSREELLVMLFDGAVRFLRLGREGMAAGLRDQQSLNLTRVQKILVELLSTLNPAAGPLVDDLTRIYWYLFDRLTHANLNDDLTAVDEVLQRMSELRDTWAEAARLYREQTAGAAVAAGVG